MEILSNGEILYFWDNRRGSTTAEPECIRNNNFAIVFELFNTQLRIIESYSIDETENGLVVHPGALVNGSCVDSEKTSSLESIMDFDEDENGENDSQIIQGKSRHHSEGGYDVLSETIKNELKNNEDLSKVEAKQKQIGLAINHPKKHNNKDFITSIHTKLVNELEPYPFCDLLVEHGFISMEENSFIMRIRDKEPRDDVIRKILFMLNKSNITEGVFKSILKKINF